MISRILLEVSPVTIIFGLLVCMFGVPMLISFLVGGLKDKKNEGVWIFWLLVILAVIIIIATVKECSSFDIPFVEPRHT